MNTFLPTTIVAGAGGATASTVLSSVGEEKARKTRRNAFIGTAVASVGTTVVGETLNCKAAVDLVKQKQLEAEASRQAYVDSLSDEELEIALRQIEEQSGYDNSTNIEETRNYRK